MKIRTGFVSNSSSSSFIIRGARFKNEELEGIKFSKSGLSIKDDVNYFDKCDGKEPATSIIGVGIASPSSGDVVELKETNDEKIKDKIEAVGLPRPAKLSTFFQFVSNDNY